VGCDVKQRPHFYYALFDRRKDLRFHWGRLVGRHAYNVDGRMKYYVTRIDLKIVDGKLVATETILTKPSEKDAAHEGARRFRALGTENVHVCKHVTKRFKKLMREQNKRRKENPLTIADIAEMAAQAEELEKANV